jgi:hypothetical protein
MVLPRRMPISARTPAVGKMTFIIPAGHRFIHPHRPPDSERITIPFVND